MLDADGLDGVGEDGERAVVSGVELARGEVQRRGTWGERERAYLAMLAVHKERAGREAVITDSGTRESAAADPEDLRTEMGWRGGRR